VGSHLVRRNQPHLSVFSCANKSVVDKCGLGKEERGLGDKGYYMGVELEEFSPRSSTATSAGMSSSTVVYKMCIRSSHHTCEICFQLQGDQRALYKFCAMHEQDLVCIKCSVTFEHRELQMMYSTALQVFLLASIMFH
jgi:hypothetical protein